MTPLRLVCSLAALTAVLVLLTAPPTAGGELSSSLLPYCPPETPESTTAPVTAPSFDDPTACQARPTRVEHAATDGLPVPAPTFATDRGEYHHLGVTTAGEWAALFGRLTVRDPGVRAGSYDFVATRFMAKRGTGGGRVAWVEAGWAETGWSGRGAQRIYTFDSAGMSWLFFDEYRIRDGDQVWMYLHGGSEAWRAWLWWGDRWQLLTSTAQPVGAGAQLEQYVEVHQARAGRAIPVPPIRIDQVRVRATANAPLESWLAERVHTAPPLATADYCLDWETRYDAWSAGDCPVTVQE